MWVNRDWRGIKVVFVAVFLAAAALSVSNCTFSPQSARKVASGISAQRIQITARSWEFVPKEVRVRVNIPVELQVTSVDVDHGIEFTDLDVPLERVPAGRTVSIRFIPDKPGIYHFRCAVVCGTGHDQMLGLLIVE